MRIDRGRLPALGADPLLRFPEIQRRTLDNGLRVWTIEHDAVPLVSFLVMLSVGASADPDDRPGLAAITSDMLDEADEDDSDDGYAEEDRLDDDGAGDDGAGDDGAGDEGAGDEGADEADDGGDGGPVQRSGARRSSTGSRQPTVRRGRR